VIEPMDYWPQRSDKEPDALPPEAWTMGPDKWRGPEPCRGKPLGDCGTEPSDHCCCCDPCLHATTDICDPAVGGCCRCVPQKFCLIFEPDTPTDYCVSRGWLIGFTQESGQRAKWTIGLQGPGAVTVSVGKPDPVNSDFPYADCTWNLEIGGEAVTDAEYEVDHFGEFNCLTPPAWIVENINVPVTVPNEPELVDCFGTLTVTEYKKQPLPFVRRFWYTDQTFPDFLVDNNACAACYADGACVILCVRRNDPGNPGQQLQNDFSWDGNGHWINGNDGSEVLEFTEVEGVCKLRIVSLNPSIWDGDLIDIDPDACGIGMNLSASDDVGNWVNISCNKCSCWEYICGDVGDDTGCRCICKELCVISATDGVISDVAVWNQATFDYPDPELSTHGWIDPDGDYDLSERLVIQRNGDDGTCELTHTNYSEPSKISNNCGDEISFHFSDTLKEMLESGVSNWTTGWCKTCGPCDVGTCLSECQDVPNRLTAEISPATWTPALGCDDGVLCFTAFTIILVLVFDVTIGQAGEWRWRGQAVFACHGCDTGGHPEIETPRNYLAELDIGCDGSVLWSVRNETDSCSEEFAFELPCGPGASWDLEFIADRIGCLCCDEAGFIINVTE